jgi:ATP-dependent Clp protease ATP-binding subunit ClpA
VAAKILQKKGVTLKDARREVEKIIHRGSGFVAVEIPFTPRAKKSLERAHAESACLGLKIIDTEHLLLGLLDQPDAVAVRVLSALGVEATELARNVLQAVGGDPASYEMRTRLRFSGINEDITQALRDLNRLVNSLTQLQDTIKQCVEDDRSPFPDPALGTEIVTQISQVDSIVSQDAPVLKSLLEEIQAEFER